MLRLRRRKQRNGPHPGSSVWSSPDFAYLWSAYVVSQLGTQISFIALPLIATITLEVSPFEVSVLISLGWLPIALISLPAGAWIDRLRRRPILIAADVSSAISLLLIPIAYLFDGLAIWLLYAVALLSGVFSVIFDIAHGTYARTVMDRKHLVAGNSALEVGRSMTRIAGPTLAGGAIEVLTAPVAIVLDSVSFLTSAVLLFRIKRPESRPGAVSSTQGPAPRIREDIVEGLRYVWRHRLLAPVAGSAALTNLGLSIVEGILIVYMVRELELAAGQIGVTFAIANLGLLLGASVSTRIVGRFGPGRTLVGAASFQAVGLLLVPMAAVAPLLVLATGQILRAFGVVVFNVNARSLRQAIVPDRLLGRTNATLQFISWGTIPVGNIAGGVIATWTGVEVALWIGVGFAITGALAIGMSRVRNLQELPVMECHS